MKRLWWIPLGLLCLVGLMVAIVQWAIESLEPALYRAGKWLNERMKENQDGE